VGTAQLLGSFDAKVGIISQNNAQAHQVAKNRKRKSRRAEKARKCRKGVTERPFERRARPSDPVVTIAKEIAHQAAEMVDASVDD